MGLFLGMESGGDVKFYSPGAPVWPQQWELMRKWEMRWDRGNRVVKFYITAWLYTQKEPHSAIWNIFKKYPESLQGLKPKPESEQPFPLRRIWV